MIKFAKPGAPTLADLCTCRQHSRNLAEAFYPTLVFDRLKIVLLCFKSRFPGPDLSGDCAGGDMRAHRGDILGPRRLPLLHRPTHRMLRRRQEQGEQEEGQGSE